MTTAPFPGTPRLPVLGSRGASEVARALTATAADSGTGMLCVTGDPGGHFHIAGGIVVAAATMGAPGVPELLARPGRDTPGAAELRALRTFAVLDAAFAVASGWIDGCYREDTDFTAVPGAGPGVEADRMITETERRLRALDGVRQVSPHRHRLIRTPLGDAVLSRAETALRHEILLHANGSRNCRELSFRLCRGLYAVTVEATRMVGEGVLTVAPPRHASVETPDGGAALPQRRRDASGINDLFPPTPATARADERTR